MPRLPSKKSIRQEGALVLALLLFLKQVTAYSRWVFAVLLALYAISGIRAIQPQESALVRRLGQLQPTLHGPGLLIGLPTPFDEVLRFETGKDLSLPVEAWKLVGDKIGDPDKQKQLSDAELTRQIQTREVEGSTYEEYENTTLDPLIHGYTLTEDYNVIQGRFSLRYRIEDPFRYATADRDMQALLGLLTRRAMAHELAALPIDASLTDKRDELAHAASADIQESCAALRLGVRVTGLDIVELSPPAQVLAAFEDVVNARQFAKTIEENSRQYRAENLARSEGDAGAIRHRAEAYRANLLATAHGEASAFNALTTNYHRQPELVARRLLRETLDTVYAQIYSRTLLPTARTQPSLMVEPSPEFAR